MVTLMYSVAGALGGDLGMSTPAEAMSECAAVAPLFACISHERLARDGALHWPCRSATDTDEALLSSSTFETPAGRAQLSAFPWVPLWRGNRQRLPVRADHRAASRALQLRHDDPA